MVSAPWNMTNEREKEGERAASSKGRSFQQRHTYPSALASSNPTTGRSEVGWFTRSWYVFRLTYIHVVPFMVKPTTTTTAKCKQHISATSSGPCVAVLSQPDPNQQAIEIRLLGLGDEPPRPVLHPPSYLGAGKVRVEWSAGGLAAGVERDHDNQDEPSSSAPLPPPSSPSPSSSPGHGVVVPRAPLSASAVDDDGEAVESAPAGPEGEGEGGQRGLGAIAAEDQQDQAEDAAAPDRGQPAASPRAATFPIHKYVLQRSCLHHYSHAAAPPAGTTAEGGGGGSGGGGWVTVHEADDVGFASSSTSFVFVDSGLAPGKTHVYR